MTVEERIRRFVVDELQWQGSTDDLSDDTSLIEGGVIDSLGIVKTISFLESDFGIKVGDDELLPGNFETIGAIAEFVRGKGLP
jgi:acyl carrier protein